MRFRFTIRDLLWMTALIAPSLGWWLDHRQTARERTEMAGLISRLESGNLTRIGIERYHNLEKAMQIDSIEDRTDQRRAPNGTFNGLPAPIR